VNSVLAVAAGGALGSVARYGFNAGVTRAVGNGYPWGVLLANVLGCFLMGIVTAYFLQRAAADDILKLFLTTGFLGGFTTFSAFSLDAMRLVHGGQMGSAASYVLASVALSIVAVFVGYSLMRTLAA
jgi:fluoride exporter